MPQGIFMLSTKLSKLTAAALFSLSASFMAAQSANATIVQFQTVLGDFSVNLYDKTTPKTVENFLAYVKSGAYTNTIIHRSVPGFIVQGGGYSYKNDAKPPLVAVTQNAAVINEPVYANKRGTIAMAKLGGQPNSATNQWFFNLADNSTTLDPQNSGFTVFGEVTGNGMAIIDAMAALSIFTTGTDPFKELPLRNYTTTDGTNGVEITDKHLVMILGVVVLDSNVDSAANLTPVKTTYTPSTGNGGGGSSNNNSSGSGGGSMGWVSLLMLLTLLSFGRSRR
jgi:peptidyl-prolyl cis-trans isomerase A (cyclophilin A)